MEDRFKSRCHTFVWLSLITLLIPGSVTKGENPTSKPVAVSQPTETAPASSVSVIEVPLPGKQTGPVLAVRSGHSYPIVDLAFSNDGKVLASLDRSGLLVLWQPSSGRQIRQASLHSWNTEPSLLPASIRGVMANNFAGHRPLVMSSHGERVICYGSSIEVFLSSGQFLKNAIPVSAVVGTPDFLHQLLTFNEGLSLLSVKQQKISHLPDQGTMGTTFFGAAAFSHDQTLVAHGGGVPNDYPKIPGIKTPGRDFAVRMWNIENNSLVWSQALHQNGIRCVAFSANDRFLATSDWSDVIHVWDAHTGRHLQRITAPIGLYSTQIAFTGEHLLAVSVIPYGLIGGFRFRATDPKAHGRGAAIVLFDVTTGQFVRSLEYEPGTSFTSWYCQTVVSSSDGKAVFGGCSDGAIIAWDPETGNKLGTFGPSVAPCTQVLTNRANSLICAKFGSDLTVWNFNNVSHVQMPLTISMEAFPAPVLSPDGRWLYGKTTDGLLGLIDAHRGTSVPLPTSTGMAFSGDGSCALLSFLNKLSLFDIRVSPPTLIHEFETSPNEPITEMQLDGKGRRAVIAGADKIHIWNPRSGTEEWTFACSRAPQALLVSGNDRYMLAKRTMSLKNSYVTVDQLIDLDTRRILVSDKEVFLVGGEDVVLTHDPEQSGSLAGDTIHIAKLSNGELYEQAPLTLPVHPASILWAQRALVILQFADHIGIWNTESRREIARIPVASLFEFRSCVVTPDDRWIVSCWTDGSLRVHDAQNGIEQWRYFLFLGGNWVVIDPTSGRFNGGDLENLSGISWLLVGYPLNPFPIEMFTRQYFTPDLAGRRLYGSLPPLEPLPSVALPPQVSIESINYEDGSSDEVRVSIKVQENVAPADAAGRITKGGARDLRVFRARQLVAFQDGDIPLQADGSARVSFSKISLSQLPGFEGDLFSAYAFSSALIKSETKVHPFTFREPFSERKQRVYVVSVGINAYEDTSLNLNYAANDAVELNRDVSRKLEALGYLVTRRLLVSGRGIRPDIPPIRPSRKNIQAVIQSLGKSHLEDDSEGSSRLELPRSRPDDIVIIIFACHGYFKDAIDSGEGPRKHQDIRNDGSFYLIPADTGEVANIVSRGISTDMLTEWVRTIDARHLIVIFDTCHSAGSVGANYRPGPLGNHGFGELAYEKRMVILAASQSKGVAIETEGLQHGVLSFALQEGLETGSADYNQDGNITLREWLNYGVTRVPQLLQPQQQSSDNTKSSGPALVVDGRRMLRGDPSNQRLVQSPQLYDQNDDTDLIIANIPSSQPPSSQPKD